MPVTPSPLRYPGGKTQLYPLIRELIKINNFSSFNYVEPFAGGAGLALKLLYNNQVNKIILNDFDPSIYSLWYNILNNNSAFCDLINDTPISIEEWLFQRKQYNDNRLEQSIELGFATFFLNRTNVSGIVKGGVIGGLKQNGKYKLGDRYNKKSLIEKIKKIHSYRKRIELYNLDAIELIEKFTNKCEDNYFINFDPPYVKKGSFLYKNSYKEEDHIKLAKKINECVYPWIVTYDICPLIAKLYKNFSNAELGINYSIGSIKEAKEFIFFSPGLKLNEATISSPVNYF